MRNAACTRARVCVPTTARVHFSLYASRHNLSSLEQGVFLSFHFIPTVGAQMKMYQRRVFSPTCTRQRPIISCVLSCNNVCGRSEMKQLSTFLLLLSCSLFIIIRRAPTNNIEKEKDVATVHRSPRRGVIIQRLSGRRTTSSPPPFSQTGRFLRCNYHQRPADRPSDHRPFGCCFFLAFLLFL